MPSNQNAELSRPEMIQVILSSRINPDRIFGARAFNNKSNAEIKANYKAALKVLANQTLPVTTPRTLFGYK